MIHITFVPRRENIDRNTLNLYCRLTLHKKVTEILLPLKVDEEWRTALWVRKYLDKVIADVHEVWHDLTSREIVPTPELIKKQFLSGGNAPLTMLQLFDKFVAIKVLTRSSLTVQGKSAADQFNYTRNYLLYFLDETSRSADMSTSEIVSSFVPEFIDFLSQYMKHEDAVMHLRRIRRVFVFGVYIGCFSDNPVQSQMLLK